VGILISHEGDFRRRNVTRDKENHFKVKKVNSTSHLYPNDENSEYVKQTNKKKPDKTEKEN
jgi:hypothetical protein